MSLFAGAPGSFQPPPTGPWLAPPDHQLAGVAPLAVPIARSADTAVSVAGLAAYPAGVEITLEVRLRAGTDSGIDPRLPSDWPRDAGRMIRFGIVLPDGSSAVAADSATPLVTRLGTTPRPLLTTLSFGADDPAHWSARMPSARRGLTYGSSAQFGGGPAEAVHRMRYWLWPLPSDGPLTFVAEFLARGLPESRVTMDAAAIRAAADRAVDLWPVTGLPEPGTPPADPVAAAAEIRAAFTRAFTGGQGVEVVLAAVDDGEALRSTLEQVRARYLSIAESARVLVGEPVFTDPAHASLPFEVGLRGPNHGTLAGAAVLVDGTWKVARETYCVVMSWAGVPCPDRIG